MSRSSGAQGATQQRFRARAAAERRRRLGRVLVAVLVLAVAAALVWAVGFSRLLTVREVQVSGAHEKDRAEIAKIAEQQVGTPLARVDDNEVTSAIEQEVPAVKSTEIDSGWPHTLNVNVTSRVPALAVRRDTWGYRLLDLDGVAFRTVRSAPEDVPTVTAQRDANVSGHGVRAAQGMLESLPEDLRSQVSDISVDAADQITFKLDDTKVVWGEGKREDLKVKVISILLEKKPGMIDVSAPEAPVTKG